jgi:hypothetical protein
LVSPGDILDDDRDAMRSDGSGYREEENGSSETSVLQTGFAVCTDRASSEMGRSFMEEIGEAESWREDVMDGALGEQSFNPQIGKDEEAECEKESIPEEK